MINAKLQNIIDTKSAIGNAINNKGGSITVDTPFYEYAPAIENISTGGGAYSTFVAQAQDNSLYTVYNGYDSQTNPTPNLSNNFTFNRWLLNNSATGSVVLSNVILTSSGTFNGPNVSEGLLNMNFVGNTASYNGWGFGMDTDNDSIYFAGYGPSYSQTGLVRKYRQDNLAIVANSSDNSAFQVVMAYNGFIYGAGFNSAGNQIRKYNPSNLSLVSNSSNIGSPTNHLKANNGFIYEILDNTVIRKYHESNLVFVSESAATGSAARIEINNGFIYVGGATNTVRKYHEGNFVFVNNTSITNFSTRALGIHNGYIYTGGADNRVNRFYESNLVFVDNTVSYGGFVRDIEFNASYVYVFGGQGQIKRYHESNLVFFDNSPTQGGGEFMSIKNGFVYAVNSSAGPPNTFVHKYNEYGITPDQTFYSITTIKE
jgi:hypothetical protein